MVGLSGYITAGVFMLIGIILITMIGKHYKTCYLTGAGCIVLGIWWALNTIYPQHPIIDGWLGWVVKIVVGLTLIPLAIDFFRENKKERAKWKEEKAEQKRKEAEKQASLYNTYDDYEYGDEEKSEKK